MKNRFLVIVKDLQTGEEKEIEKFDSDGWINASVDESEDIDFQEFCGIIQHYFEVMGDV